MDLYASSEREEKTRKREHLWYMGSAMHSPRCSLIQLLSCPLKQASAAPVDIKTEPQGDEAIQSR